MSRNARVAMLLAGLLAQAFPVEGGEETMFAEARVLCPVLLRVPAESRGIPLVVGLHGKGGSAGGFVPVWEAFAHPRPVLVVPEAPYALLLEGGHLGWSWDFPSKDPRLWARADPEVARYILAVAREVRTAREAGGVYLLAHSQGVSYAFMAMVEDPGLVRGVIAFAGILPADMLPDNRLAAAAGRTRVFIAHGRKDQAIGLESSRKAKERLERLGFDVILREFDGGHTVPPEVLQEAQRWIAATETAAKARQGPGGLPGDADQGNHTRSELRKPPAGALLARIGRVSEQEVRREEGRPPVPEDVVQDLGIRRRLLRRDEGADREDAKSVGDRERPLGRVFPSREREGVGAALALGVQVDAADQVDERGDEIREGLRVAPEERDLLPLVRLGDRTDRLGGAGLFAMRRFN